MDAFKNLEEYSKFIEMLVTVTATNAPMMDFVHEENDYIEYLQLIGILLNGHSYTSLLFATDWKKILNFVGDCRYSMPNITEEQFLVCNQMIEQINEYMGSSAKPKEYATYISDISQTLVQIWSPKKRRLLKQEQQKFDELLLDYYHSVYMESSFIDEVLINGYVDCFELSKSLINENILLSLICGLDVNVDSVVYLIQSPLTPYAMTRILNFITLYEDGIKVFESIIQASNNYIQTGETFIMFQDQTYKIRLGERINDYSNILKNDSYERIMCYLHQRPYKKQSKQKKLEKR